MPRNRKLYRLKYRLDGKLNEAGYFGVYRTDQNLGLIGYVHEDMTVNIHHHHSRGIPRYIIKEIENMLNPIIDSWLQ